MDSKHASSFHFTFEELLANANEKPQKPESNKPYLIKSESSFLYLIHENFANSRDNIMEIFKKNMLEKAHYSGHKVHFNFENPEQTAAAWNIIAPFLIDKDSPMKQAKVVVPDRVKKTHEENLKKIADSRTSSQEAEKDRKISEADRERRLFSAQVTLYIYSESSTNKQDIDYESYINLIKKIEKALLDAGIKPLTDSKVPLSDTRISLFASMREEIDEKGVSIVYDQGTNRAPSEVIKQFQKGMSDPEYKFEKSVKKTEPEKTFPPMTIILIVSILKLILSDKTFLKNKISDDMFFDSKMEDISRVLTEKDEKPHVKFDKIKKICSSALDTPLSSGATLSEKSKEFFQGIKEGKTENLIKLSNEFDDYKKGQRPGHSTS